LIRFVAIALFMLLASADSDAATMFGTLAGYSGSTAALTTTGYSFGSPVLYALPTSSMQFSVPYTIAFSIKGSTFGTATTSVIDSRNGSLSVGLFSGSSIASSAGGAFKLKHQPGDSSFSCINSGSNCARRDIYADGNWHHQCWVVNGTTATNTITSSDFYIDGVLVDHNLASGHTYIPQATTQWMVTDGSNSAFAVRDIRIYTVALGRSGCGQLAGLAASGVTPTSGALQSNLAAYWPMNNCTGTGCPDGSGNGNDLSNGLTPAACTITSPSTLTGLTGPISLSATCTSSAGINAVFWFVDGASQGSSSTSPSFTVTWDSTKFPDGAHDITLLARTPALAGTLVHITASTSNATVTNKTIYYDPVNGVDPVSSPGTACQSSSAPCKTLHGVQLVINANPLHGGDAIRQKAGTNLNIPDLTTANTLSLAGNGCSVTACNANQNTYPSTPIIFSTYSGTGQCTILAGVTTDCASITLSANGTVPPFAAPLNFFNIGNLQLSNFRIFGTQPNAQAGGCGTLPSTAGCASGIRYAGVSYFIGTPYNSQTSISNVEVVDFWLPIVATRDTDLFGSNGAGQTMCGVTVQNNYVHGSTVGSPIHTGIALSHAGCGVYSGTVSVGGTMNSNFVQFIGGDPLQNGQNGTAVGLFIGGDSVNDIGNYNADGHDSYNARTCGGGYALEYYRQRISTMNGNEAYNRIMNTKPPPGTCDTGGFDFDISVSQGIMEFNYAHDMYGPGTGTFGTTAGTFPAGFNTIAYNIFENTITGSNQSQWGVIGLDNGAAGPTNIFNNTTWNGTNTQTGINGQIKGGVYGIGGHCAIVTTAPNYYANGIHVSNSTSFLPALMGTGGYASVGYNCQGYTFRNNDYFVLGPGTIQWLNMLTNTTFNSLASWNTASGDNGVGTNPNFAGAGGGALTVCYAPLTGAAITAAPVQPGTIPCPTNYQLQTGNTLIGTGLNLTQPPYNLTLPATDFFNVTIPNGASPNGYNYGVDGAHH
jgi:hypothetical protein